MPAKSAANSQRWRAAEGLQLPPRLPHEGARDYALRLLKYNIVRLHLPPGAMLSSAELAEATGISRTPFREAMQELSQSGILHIFPQAGSQVSYIDYSRIHEARFIRLALETAVVKLACESVTQKACEDIEEILFQQENSLKRGDQDSLLEHDDRFHKYLFALVDKEYSFQIMESVLIHFDRVRRLSLGALSEVRITTDHRDVFKAIKRGDKAGAAKIMTAHLSRYREDETIIRTTYPKYFEDAM